MASCHGGGCLELQSRSWRWGEEGKLPLRWEVAVLPPQGKGSVSQWPLKESVLRKLPGQETKVPALRLCSVVPHGASKGQ